MDYSELKKQVQALTEDCPYLTANLANTAALLMQMLPEINWAGFYILQEDALILGPFQGKPACIRIETGKGVCGTAVKEDRIQRIADVHAFPGHIACDGASNSELVIPIHKDQKIWGVLDIDSPVFDRFTEEDQQGLAAVCSIIEQFLSVCSA